MHMFLPMKSSNHHNHIVASSRLVFFLLFQSIANIIELSNSSRRCDLKSQISNLKSNLFDELSTSMLTITK